MREALQTKVEHLESELAALRAIVGLKDQFRKDLVEEVGNLARQRDALTNALIALREAYQRLHPTSLPYANPIGLGLLIIAYIFARWCARNRDR